MTRGPLAFLSTPVVAVNDALMRYGQEASTYALSTIGTYPESARVVTLLGPLMAAVLPGFVCILLVVIVKATSKAKKFLTALSVIIGALSFLVLPVGQAAIVLAVTLGFASISGLVSGVAIQIPLVVFATSLGITTVSTLLAGGDTQVASAITAFSDAFGGGDPSLWRAVITATAIAPFFGAAALLVRD